MEFSNMELTVYMLYDNRMYKPAVSDSTEMYKIDSNFMEKHWNYDS